VENKKNLPKKLHVKNMTTAVFEPGTIHICIDYIMVPALSTLPSRLLTSEPCSICFVFKLNNGRTSFGGPTVGPRVTHKQSPTGGPGDTSDCNTTCCLCLTINRTGPHQMPPVPCRTLLNRAAPYVIVRAITFIGYPVYRTG